MSVSNGAMCESQTKLPTIVNHLDVFAFQVILRINSITSGSESAFSHGSRVLASGPYPSSSGDKHLLIML